MTLEFERSIATPINQTRKEIVRVLRNQGFTIGVERTTLLEAQRGSAVSAAIRPSKAPLAVEVRLEPSGDGTAVAVALRDRWPSPVVFGMNGAYRRMFEETQAAIDRVLAALDPGAAGSFEAPRFKTKNAEVAVLDRANAATGRASEKAADRTNEMLEGDRGRKAPKAWKGVRGVRFDGPEGSVLLGLDETQAHLTVAMLVGSQPGSMPENLASEVERFAARVESTLGASPPEQVTIPVSEDERPVFEFLHQQSRIRETVPLRMLNICQDCRFEKVTNPDYERLTEKNRKLRSMGGAVGATVSLSHASVNPFVLVGKVFQMKKLDPDFVCPRCQGMHAESFIITFCPRCGERRQEAVLRICPKCRYDFRSELGPERLWVELPKEPEPSVISALPGAPPPRPDVTG